MSDSDFDALGAYNAAAKLGLRVVFPEANQLFIDIDSDEDFEIYEQNLAIAREEELLEGKQIRESVKASKSGLPNRHITLTFERNFDAVTRVAWQALLGSDRKHELLSMVAYARGNKSPTMFFEK